MKGFLGLFIFLSVYANVSVSVAETHVWSGVASTGVFTGDENIIENGAVVNHLDGDDNIVVNLPMSIINNGTINGNIDTNGNNIVIQSAGDINGNIIACDDHTCVTQLITSNAELKTLNIVNGTYNVRLQDVDRADFTGIQNLSGQTYRFSNSSVVMDDFSDWQNWDKTVELDGVNTLYINNSYTVNSGDVIRGVVYPENINVVFLDPDKMHIASLLPTYYGVVLRVVRELNYENIFDDNRGVLLNNIRQKNPNDKMLVALDNADNINTMRHIMNSSYVFNQKVLLRPINVINKFILLDMSYDDSDLETVIKPFYIGGDTASYGADAYVTNKFSDLNVNFGLHLNQFGYENKFNDFNGMLIGADINAKQKIQDFWINGMFGFDFVKFKTDDMYINDNDIKNNPDGYAVYGRIGGGYDYTIFDNFIFTPFIAGWFLKNWVASISDTDINIKCGGNLKYSFTVDGLKYEYDLSDAFGLNGDVLGSFKMGVTSIQDSVGGYVNASVLKTKEDTNYKLSVGLKMLF